MSLQGLTEHTCKVPSCPKPVFYLANGPVDGPLVIFVHGWPELSVSWRYQLHALGSLGFRAIAPDMRGYGRSYIPDKHDGVSHENNVADLIGLMDALRGPGSQAVIVGHDWGTPIVYSLAMHYPERCAGIGGVCIAHAKPRPVGPANFIAGLKSMPDAGPFDYAIQHQEEPKAVAAELDADVRYSFKCMFQACREMPAPRMFNQYITMFDQRKRFKETDGQCSFFVKPPNADGSPRDAVEVDTRVTTEDDINRYVEGVERNGGFTVPNFYYHNHDINQEYNNRDVHNDGILKMPTLLITAAFDVVCSPAIASKAEESATNLSRAQVNSGHWAQQERPREVNAALVKWIATALPNYWPQ